MNQCVCSKHLQTHNFYSFDFKGKKSKQQIVSELAMDGISLNVISSSQPLYDLAKSDYELPRSVKSRKCYNNDGAQIALSTCSLLEIHNYLCIQQNVI